MNTHKTGILVRFPLAHKKGKKHAYKVTFSDFIIRKIQEGLNLGYKCFVFEISDDDFDCLDFTVEGENKKALSEYLKSGIRLSFYIKGKKQLTSDSLDEIEQSKFQIISCLGFIEEFKLDGQEFPLILHIGGAKGDRKGTMEDFCKKLESFLDKEKIQRIAVINDEKPSLFSVKDLLPGVFYKIKIPIVFRSTSYPTNQGNLTLNESLFLAASTWKRNINPIFIYLPGNTKLSDDHTRPFGLELDFVFDNRLPEP
jgi:UV DNA damage repair endonuclease